MRLHSYSATNISIAVEASADLHIDAMTISAEGAHPICPKKDLPATGGHPQVVVSTRSSQRLDSNTHPIAAQSSRFAFSRIILDCNWL
jgi:hypothetical protein